jgi:hypothetical protein
VSEGNPATIEKVIDWVRQHPLPDGRIIPVCIWGERGAGKTSFVRSYCSQRQLGFRGYHPAHDNSGSDIVGIAYLDEKLERTVYARPMWLPSENDSVMWQKTGVLFIDELNRASLPVLQGLYEPLGEGTIEHSGWKLPRSWGFICAANPPKEGYDVNHLDDALMDRMVHVPLNFDVIRWAAWAGKAKVHPDLVSFTARFPTMVAEAEAALPDEIEIKTTPRSLEYLARLYEPGMSEKLLKLLGTGLIGESAADSLIAHLKSDEKPVSAEEIFSGHFDERLGAHITQGREDLLEASQTLLVSMMTQYKPDAQVVPHLVRYMHLIGRERAKSLWDKIADQAPHWLDPLRQALS